jgi:hypothetical protein
MQWPVAPLTAVSFSNFPCMPRWIGYPSRACD